MKRTLIFALMVAVGLWVSGVATAGDYHVGTGLLCSDCHTMHASAAHSYTADTGTPWTLGGSAPYDYLLTNSPDTLCLSCHGGSTTATGSTGLLAPDVEGAAVAGNAAVRQAGMLTTGGAPYETFKGHTLGAYTAIPGSTAGAGTLSCTSCHDAHGVATQWRNLKSSLAAVTYVNGANDTTKDVRQVAMTDTPTKYSYSNISFNKIATPGYPAFCQSCHTDFHGSPGGSEVGGQSGGDNGTPFVRHPTREVAIGANSGLHSTYTNWWGTTSPAFITNGRLQVMSASGTVPATDNQPSCMSCHRAHGSVNPFGLIYAFNDGTSGGQLKIENGDTGTGTATLAATCNKCHKKGY